MSRRPLPLLSWSRPALGASAILLALSVVSASAGAGASATPSPRLSPFVSVASTGDAAAWANGVSCATATDCLAVGTTSTTLGAASSTVNAGQTWSPLVAVDSPFVQRLMGVSCPSTTTCIAVGSSSAKPVVAVVATWSGGVWTWSAPVSITAATNPSDERLLMDSVSCVSVTSCVTVGDDQTSSQPVMSYTNDGGRTWTPATAVAGDNATPNGYQSHLNSIVCPSPTSCLAVGNDTADNGMVAIATLNTLTSVWSFASPADLVTGVNTNTGQLASVSCVSSSRCVAVGQDRAGDGVVSLGFLVLGTWIWTNESDVTADSTGVGVLTAVGCRANGDCVAAGQDAKGLVTTVSTDTGSTWSDESPVPSASPDPSLSSITCVSTGTCLGVGSSTNDFLDDSMLATTSSDGGVAWNATQVVTSAVPSGGTLNNVSCPSTTHCVAVGLQYDSTSYVATSNDGGATWSREVPLPSPPSDVTNYVVVSCPTARLCVVAGRDSKGTTTVTRSTDGGSVWSTPTFIPSDASGGGQVDALDCATPTRCVVVGSDQQSQKTVAISTTGGLTWSGQHTLPAGPLAAGGFVSVSCPSATRCVATGDNASNNADVALSTDGGLTWQPEKITAPFTFVYSVSCSSVRRCAAVGNYEGVSPVVYDSANGGATWSAPHILKTGAEGAAYFVNLSCSASSNCVAVGAAQSQTGVYATSVNDGRTWSGVHVIAGPDATPYYFAGADCVSATRCVLVGAGPGSVGAATTVRFAATVHFAARGGRGSMAPQVAFSTTRLHADAFTRKGYRFAGWATTPRGPLALKNKARYSFSANITLYAVWSPVS